MKKITLLFTLLIACSLNAQTVLFEDSFETYDDFAVNAIGDWTLIDNGATSHYGSNDFNFKNEAYTGVSIVFNPSLAINETGEGTAADNEDWRARTGERGMYFFAAQSLDGVAPPKNDDYLISPNIAVSAVGETTLSFWAKSLTTQFGLEEFEVLVSTTGRDIADFTTNLSAGIISAPASDYKQFSYDLNAFEGQAIYIAIHYVGQDSFVLMVDDFSVVSKSPSLDEQLAQDFSQFIDNEQKLHISATNTMNTLEVYNILGEQVMTKKLNSTKETIDLSRLTTGLYIASIASEGQHKTFKIQKN